MRDETLLYYQLGLKLYPGTLQEALHVFPTNVKAARQLTAEMCYVYEHNVIPEWAVHLETFEVVEGSYIFVHRDKNTA